MAIQYQEQQLRWWQEVKEEKERHRHNTDLQETIHQEAVKCCNAKMGLSGQSILVENSVLSEEEPTV